jgi:hypothetical protein
MQNTLIPVKEITVPFHSDNVGRRWLRTLGDAMARHRRFILGLQWIVVVIYVFLVAAPAFLPLPAEDAHLWNDLTRFAQFAFWGIWWPFVMLSMMLMGRVWCGVFCPEGALSEFASRRGLGLAIPRFLRWGGWPFVSFALTTLIGQLTSIYEYPKPALLILGGSTVAAVVVGFLYGRGVRVWCRYLCPANGVFALLARLAPVHFSVNEAAWNRSGKQRAVDCPPLLDVKHQAGSGACHACGRCSGHREAVSLVPRSISEGVLTLKNARGMKWESITLLFGVLGVATGAFQWSASPYYVKLNMTLAALAVKADMLWLLNANAPWWLLTHYPEINDAFTWLDGISITLYIMATALVLGAGQVFFLSLAQRTFSGRVSFWRLALGLTPLGGISVFLGLSMLTLNQLHQDGIDLPGISVIRAALLALAVLWSLWIVWQTLGKNSIAMQRRLLAMVFVSLALALPVTSWAMLFFVW